jgi:CarD family transcriptional regulator
VHALESVSRSAARRAGGYAEGMQLDVGDVVVYAAHGIGRIVAREQRTVRDGKQEIVVLELSEGLTISLPVERAHEQLRAVASEADLERVRKTLREEPVVSEKPWLGRQRDALAKLTGGDALDLAEIVRDGATREQVLNAKGKKTQLSPGERDVFVMARQLLSSEIACARGLDADEAEQWIDQQLAHA